MKQALLHRYFFAFLGIMAISLTGSYKQFTSPREQNAEPMCIHALERAARHSPQVYMLDEVLRTFLRQRACLQTGEVQLQSILFVIMCSSTHIHRIRTLKDTWLQLVPPQNVILIGDDEVPGLNVVKLPLLPADTYVELHAPRMFANSYQQANLRHLKSVQWLGMVDTAQLVGKDWVLMLDDDSFVNPPMLQVFLQGVPSALPLLFGFLWDGQAPTWDVARQTWIEPSFPLSWPCGGAGMLMSSVAFRRLARGMFTDTCAMTTFYNDANIGECASRVGVTKVHSMLFKPENETVVYNPSYKPSFMHDVGMWVTKHRASHAQMLQYTCIVAKRYQLMHHLCRDVLVVCDPICHMRT